MAVTMAKPSQTFRTQFFSLEMPQLDPSIEIHGHHHPRQSLRKPRLLILTTLQSKCFASRQSVEGETEGTNLMIPNNNLSVIRGRNKPRIGYDSEK